MPSEFSNPSYIPSPSGGAVFALVEVATAVARLAMLQNTALGRAVRQTDDNTVWALKPNGLASVSGDWQRLPSPAPFATAAQGAKADTALQNGSLYATAAQGAKADTALQNAGAFATAAQGGKADTALQNAGAFATAAQGGKADTALQNAGAFATAAQGGKADTALQNAGAFATAAQGSKADTSDLKLFFMQAAAGISHYTTYRFSQLAALIKSRKSLTETEWGKGVKAVSVRDYSPSLLVKSSTGYAKLLGWDGEFGAVTGSGNAASLMNPPPASALAFPYNSTIPKILIAFPCTVAGVISGSITDVSADDKGLTALDVSGCVELNSLVCSNNSLGFLDVSNCPLLTLLDCTANSIVSLGLSGCSGLTGVSCGYNAITSLYLNDCTALSYLYCWDNALTSLYVSGCALLTNLYCENNHLTEIDLSGDDSLSSVSCSGNLLPTSAVDDLILSLPPAANDNDGFLNLSGTGNAARSAASDAKVALLVGGGWEVMTNG